MHKEIILRQVNRQINSEDDIRSFFKFCITDLKLGLGFHPDTRVLIGKDQKAIFPRKIKSKNAGFCFKKNGWRTCGISKARKLIILEKHADTN